MPPPRVTAFLSHRSTCSCRNPRPSTRPRSGLQPRPQPCHKPSPRILFFSTSTRVSREPNYYEILDIPITATAAEIKKQFYALSLRHHPDRNRDDPTASQRFARISAAYNVLGNASKRASYDRDHGFHHLHHHHHHHGRAPGQHPMGSHSSYTANLHHQRGESYAGSRPASGLSKRRGPFRGPPPSFYEQGGAGAGSAGAGGFASSSAGTSQRAAHGFDPEDPTAFIDRNPLGHFNARGHFRTQTAEDARRRERRTRAMRATIRDEYIGGGPGDFVLRFLVVCGSLVVAGAMTGLFKWPTTSGSTASTSSSGSSSESNKVARRRREAMSVSS
ncbi:hypothetical protein NUU61_009821 [Penicillium alfredii]|uniref:J domain-containing protein n=1 Tax=Penicillium alfredii TaxID=1506179 RepID=A0A9W9JUD7_9EURO|nr:uncharacterized protein NUU61_009821 [Penicillium alfredii]KAJ5081557.1 hypothetical protein NUU61_009821 [Penicillium alfredii]